tara:strand:- start:95 stop:280 length:186 start_codon:yes stop_codon:yes gene_type:complete
MKSKTYQYFVFDTVDGPGEATKERQGEPWDVNVPWSSFRFYGSKDEVKKEIERRKALANEK